MMLSQFATVIFATMFTLVFALHGSQANAQMTIRTNEGAKGDSLGQSVTKPTQTITRSSTNGQTTTTITESVSGSGLTTETATSVAVTPVPQASGMNWMGLVTMGIPFVPLLFTMGGDKDKKEEDSDEGTQASGLDNNSKSPQTAADAAAKVAGEQVPKNEGDSPSRSNYLADSEKKVTPWGGESANDNGNSPVVRSDDPQKDLPVDSSDNDMSLHSCGNGGNVPEHVMKAMRETMEYRSKCTAAQGVRAESKIVINDYSFKNGLGMMYIFDTRGECMYKARASYGNGFTEQHKIDPNVGTTEKGKSCASGGDNATPAGMHITQAAPGSSFPDALAMAGLEGQGSLGRLIRIHGTATPGYGNTQGCTAVGDISTVSKLIGVGSIVYNYFGDAGAADGCSCPSVGFGSHDGSQCKVDKPETRCEGTAASTNRRPANGGSGGGMDNN